MDKFFEPVQKFGVKFGLDLVKEVENREVEFYLYLIPPALVPWITSNLKLPPVLKSYIDITVISIYTTVLFNSKQD